MNHDVTKSVVRNTSVMMVSQVATWISSFVLMMFLPRHLGSEDFGRLFLAMSIAMTFQAVIEFGGPNLVAKELARSRDKAEYFLANTLLLRALLWLVSIIAMGALGYLAGYPDQVNFLILVLGISKLWECAGRVFSSGFQGFESMQYSTVGAILERVFLTSCAVAALMLGATSTHIAIIMGLSTLLNFAVSAKFMRRFVKRLDQADWKPMLSLLKAGLPYFMMSVFAVVYFRIDAVMLSLMVPDAVVGWYGAAHRFFDGLMFLPMIFTTAVFPVFSRLSVNDSTSLAVTTHRSIEFILLAGIPIAVLVFAGSREIISLFFGLGDYAPAVLLLQLFAVGLLLVYIDFILVSVMIAVDKQSQWTTVAFVAMLINPLLNYFLIPLTHAHYGNGGIGATLATIFTEFLIMCMVLSLLPEWILGGARAEKSLKYVFSGVLMALGVWLLYEAGISLIVQVIAGIAIYGFVLVNLKAVEMSELQKVIRFLSFRNLYNMMSLQRAVGEIKEEANA